MDKFLEIFFGVLYDWFQAWGFTSSPSVGEFLASLAFDNSDLLLQLALSACFMHLKFFFNNNLLLIKKKSDKAKLFQLISRPHKKKIQTYDPYKKLVIISSRSTNIIKIIYLYS